MKYLKMLGLAAVAALAVMAFVGAGAGTASADELCTANENPCSEANRITSIQWSLTAGKSTIVESGSLTLETCTTGMLLGDIVSQGPGINPNGPITVLTWGTEATPCTNTIDTTKLGKLSMESVGSTNGTVIGSDTEWTSFIKSLGVSCTYGTGTGTDLGTITGGTNKLLIVTSFPKTAGGLACPSSSTWTAEYTITNHSVVFVINN